MDLSTTVLKGCRVAESADTNPYNLECHWYTPWGDLLREKLEEFRDLLVHPQLTFLYNETNRDKDEERRLTPDFLVNIYKLTNDTIKYKTIISWEVKRKCDNVDNENLDSRVSDASKQMRDQVSSLFTNRDNMIVIGMVAVGPVWRYYRYSRNMRKRKHGKDSKSNKSYDPLAEENGSVDVDKIAGLELDFRSQRMSLYDDNHIQNMQLFIENVRMTVPRN
ncbi:hypothetical protein K439DRAFT_1636758 [Ramaria rubella]|nr:hypothetical protein K439DRAFT_1636758 [Ramaria rubella]